MMATKQDGDMDDLVSGICPNIDFFERKKFKDKLLEYLTHVSVPELAGKLMDINCLRNTPHTNTIKGCWKISLKSRN